MNFSELFSKISACETEAELETLSDITEESMLAGHITKIQYKQLDSLLDDQISYIVEKELK